MMFREDFKDLSEIMIVDYNEKNLKDFFQGNIM